MPCALEGTSDEPQRCLRGALGIGLVALEVPGRCLVSSEECKSCLRVPWRHLRSGSEVPEKFDRSLGGALEVSAPQRSLGGA